MPAGDVLVDTNLLVRLTSPGDPQHEVAATAVENLTAEGRRLCLVPQCLYEYHVVATRPRENNGLLREPSDVDREIEAFLARFHLLRDERGIFTRWRELMRTHPARGRKAHDSRLVAAALRHAIPDLLTFNGKDFTRYPQIVVLDPAAV